MTAPLKFNVKKLREQGETRVRELVAPDEFQECLAGSAFLAGPLSVELDFSARGDGILLRGSANGEWELECGRCLSRKPTAYRAGIEAAFPASSEAVDAGEEVRQALVLAVPIRAYCRPDCKGLCLRCGADKNLGDCGCPPRPDFNAVNKGESHA